MNDWHWPQYVMMCWFLFGAAVAVVRAAKHREYGSKEATIYILVSWVLTASLVATLSAGGFW